MNHELFSIVWLVAYEIPGFYILEIKQLNTPKGFQFMCISYELLLSLGQQNKSVAHSGLVSNLEPGTANGPSSVVQL